VTTKKSFRINN